MQFVCWVLQCKQFFLRLKFWIITTRDGVADFERLTWCLLWLQVLTSYIWSCQLLTVIIIARLYFGALFQLDQKTSSSEKVRTASSSGAMRYQNYNHLCAIGFIDDRFHFKPSVWTRSNWNPWALKNPVYGVWDILLLLVMIIMMMNYYHYQYQYEYHHSWWMSCVTLTFPL